MLHQPSTRSQGTTANDLIALSRSGSCAAQMRGDCTPTKDPGAVALCGESIAAQALRMPLSLLLTKSEN